MAFPDWVIGVILIIVGSLGNNFGNNLVSLGHTHTKAKACSEKSSKLIDSDGKGSSTKNLLENIEEGNVVEICGDGTKQDEKVEEEKESCWSYRTVGTIIFIFGNLFTFGSFGFGAQSLLASLESIQFVSNLVFAKYCHNERVTYRMMIATFMIVAGNVLVVIFAEHQAILYTSQGMIKLYSENTAYHVYLCVAFVGWVFTSWTYLKYHNSRVKEGVLLWQHTFMEPFCYSISSAIIGTQAVLNSKCMSMLIQVTLRGKQNEFTHWFIYFILATWLILVVYWLQRLDNGLALFPPLFIIPVMQVFFVFFAILCGGIYFEEFHHFGTDQWIGFIFGVAMILAGVYGLAPTDMVLTAPPGVVVPLNENTATAAPSSGGNEYNANSTVTTKDIEMTGNQHGLDNSLIMTSLSVPATRRHSKRQQDGEDRELNEVLAPVLKEKPASIRGLNLYTPVDNSPDENEDDVSPTNEKHIKPPSSPKGFSSVKLEPLDHSELSASGVSTKKNRKVVKRGDSGVDM